MGSHAYGALATCLVWALVTGCRQPQATLREPATAAEIDALISQLSDPQRDWAASARLQKLGAPAIAALVAHLRQDPFADSFHGNHSSTMKVLEKIGEPSIPVLDAALTPELSQSGTTYNPRYVRSAILVMARIDRARAAESLIRIARSEIDVNLRAEALEALLGPEQYPGMLSKTGRWEACLGISRWPWPGMGEGEAPNMATALRPLLPEISALLQKTAAPPSRIRLAAAHILARWGADDYRIQGEHELMAMADLLSTREQAMQALGMLQVQSASQVIKKQIAAADNNDELKRTIAEALFRLDDPGYFTIVTELMSSRQEDTRRWSIRLAQESHNLLFVPHLIDRLQDTGWNGITTSTQSPGHEAIMLRHTLQEDALLALGRLTFQELGSDPEPWRRWWAANQTSTWESLLSQFVAARVPELAGSEPYISNHWMYQLQEASSPGVLPFVEAFLNNPRLDLSSTGPNEYGGDPPLVLPLLLELVRQHSATAKHLLYECLAAKDYYLHRDCPFAVAVFDKPRALDWLASELGNRDPWAAAQAAESLVHLGDPRGIPTLIDELSANNSGRSELAYYTLQHYTQEDIPFDPKAPVTTRSAASERWRQWWLNNKSAFTVKVRAAQIDTEVFM